MGCGGNISGKFLNKDTELKERERKASWNSRLYQIVLQVMAYVLSHPRQGAVGECCSVLGNLRVNWM